MEHKHLKGAKMSAPKNRLGLVSLVLILPALFFSVAGVLYLAFGIEGANRMLDGLLGHTVFKLLLSPLVVLGGPLVAFALNAWKVFHFSADVVTEEFVIAVSVKRLSGHLLCLALAGGLLLLLVCDAFVENFKIVARLEKIWKRCGSNVWACFS